MDNINRHLNEQVMREMVQGGPAYYRPAHQASNRLAQYRELAEEQNEEDLEVVKGHRMLCVRLPWMVGLGPGGAGGGFLGVFYYMNA